MSEYIPPQPGTPRDLPRIAASVGEEHRITVAFRPLRAALVIAGVVTEEQPRPWVLTRPEYLPDFPWGQTPCVAI